jgi:peptide/nickel transport system substrate-binding protein
MRFLLRGGRTAVTIAAAGALALTLAACGGDDDGNEGDTGNTGGTLVFGSSADPVILDGAFVSDGESLRPIRQIFETLVTTKEGGTDIVPLLAKTWTPSDDGLEWTFDLQTGVKFHDGTDFNAEAVCTNFDRWYNFTGVLQSASVSYYYQTVFGGYKTNDDPNLPESLYKSCEATDDHTAVITLSRASSTFLSGQSLPSFSIASPDSLEKYDADSVSGTGDAPNFDGTFGTEHPIGTGPFKFKSWDRGTKLTLERNDDYWGDKAHLDTLVFQPIADGPARLAALQAGDIDGYDLVDPASAATLANDDQFQILKRPAFNVGYLGFNSSIPPLDNQDIRKAIAYAIDKDKIISTIYPPGAEAAIEFMPPELFGWTEDVEKYEYDPDMAKQMIAESGVTNPAVEFWYPTDVERPYMPDPKGVFELMKADLEAVGFTVTPKSAPWNPDYLAENQAGTQQLYLLGWTGDFGDPDNFVGTFFQAQSPQWGFNDPAIFNALNEAEAEPDVDKRTEDYQNANKLIMDFVPGVPYVHTQPSIAFRAGITGFVPSPTSNEDFAKVSVPSE